MDEGTETYELEIIHDPPSDGLTRYPMVKTKATGISDLHHVDDIRYIFEDISAKMPGSKVKVVRRIAFYCHACNALIGEKVIPLRVEHFRPIDFQMSDASVIDLNTEMYRCLSCGHHTRFNIQDPVLLAY